MPAESRTIHYRAIEFLYRNHHYPPGWYFYDEEEDLYGPFLNHAHCEAGLKLYLNQLMAGRSPTQLTVREKHALMGPLTQLINEQEQAASALPDIPLDIQQALDDEATH